MTHYPVFVLAHNIEEAQSLLAPFEEYGANGTITKHTTFEDHTDEVVEGWETDTVTCVVMPDGKLLDPYDEAFRVGGFGICFSTNPAEQTHRVPAELEKREIPVKEIYSDMDEYAREYDGYDPHPDKAGAWGRWYNDQGYWDFYILGGRWRGQFSTNKQDDFSLEDWNGDLPQALITPDGEWHARGGVACFGYWGDENEEGWAEKVKALLEQHAEYTIHNYDLHK